MVDSFCAIANWGWQDFKCKLGFSFQTFLVHLGALIVLMTNIAVCIAVDNKCDCRQCQVWKLLNSFPSMFLQYNCRFRSALYLYRDFFWGVVESLVCCPFGMNCEA